VAKEEKFLKKRIIDKRYITIILMSGFLTAAILLINYFYILPLGIPTLYMPINIVAIFILITPIILVRYVDYSRSKEVEEMFPIFLRDFVETIRGGFTVPQAFKSVSRNDYKALTPYIKKMSAQMNWGISVEKVLLKFAKETNSKLIGRIVSSVIESHRFGGNLADTFEALSNTSVEVEKLRVERRMYLNSQMMTGYIIFFVFLAVIIGLEKFLTPSLSNVSTGQLFGSVGGAGSKELVAEYRDIYRNLILIQGFFAGIAVGKMAEGAMAAGLKHSIFMMFSGFIIFTLSVSLF
jgi:archaellum biogenesis protein FlaJ (TadC family)